MSEFNRAVQDLQQLQQKVREENIYENAKAAYANQAQGIGLAGMRRSSLYEEAEKNVSHHQELVTKAHRAMVFFRDHPEFDEFIRLIREGVVSI